MTGRTAAKRPRGVLSSGGAAQRIWSEALLRFGFVLFMAVGALGEYKTVNAMLGSKPKAVTIAVILLAVGYTVVFSDLRYLRDAWKPYLMFTLLIALLMLFSFVIWIANFTDTASIVRGCQKMAYQLISMSIAFSAVWLFGTESVDLFCLAMALANTVIMLLEMRTFGVGASISSFVHNLLTFGDAVGFARNIEIHELTFLFGQFILYYLLFYEPHDTAQKIRRRVLLAVSVFFFFAGLKRIAVAAVVAAVIYGWIALRSRNRRRLVIGVGVVFFFFYYAFLVMTWNGSLAVFLESIGINMMGRTYIWSLASRYCTISPFFMGLGFEAVDALAKSWANAGLLQAAFMLHNDILKVYIELGFPGFTIWSLLQYVVCPVWFSKTYDEKAALCYMTELFYMSFTYMTDNTAFYYWCTMGLRMIPMASALAAVKYRSTAVWRPLSKREFDAAVVRRVELDASETRGAEKDGGDGHE